jgi:hypothetical protein
MRFVSQKLALLMLACGALGPFAACHAALAADPPRPLTPTVDIEVEDRAPDKSSHVARFSLSLVDGRAQIQTRDANAKYDLGVHTVSPAEKTYSLVLKRAGGIGEIDLSSAIPQNAGPRVIIAKIDRADGHLTSVVAQVR